MSASEPTAHLIVPPGRESLEIDLVDAELAPASSGVGGLDVKLTPGLYEIHFREGTSSEMRLVKLVPGENIVPLPDFAPASPAPIDQSATSFEHHQVQVLGATDAIANECAAPGPETGGVVVMVRNVRGQEALAFPKDLEERFRVFDAAMNPVDPAGEGWTQDVSKSGAGRAPWAVWRRAVVPGGYALRIEDSEEARYQSLWVDEGWQTTLFIPNTPVGPVPELATVHTTRVGQWSPSDEGGAVALALESVITGLRTGRAVVPADLEKFSDAKFVNPFLGIAGAHALLATPEPSLRLLQTVVDNLTRMLPQNPDVIALEHRAHKVMGATSAGPREGVVWPPMMYVGYRALLDADAMRPGVISDGSAAETAAARLRVAGLWTTWAVEPSRGIARSIGEAMGVLNERLDPVIERLTTYVDGAAKINDTTTDQILDQASVEELALKTGLPFSAVRHGLNKLKEER